MALTNAPSTHSFLDRRDLLDPGNSAVCIERVVIEAKAVPDDLAIDLGNAQIRLRFAPSVEMMSASAISNAVLSGTKDVANSLARPNNASASSAVAFLMDMVNRRSTISNHGPFDSGKCHLWRVQPERRD